MNLHQELDSNVLYKRQACTQLPSLRLGEFSGSVGELRSQQRLIMKTLLCAPLFSWCVLMDIAVAFYFVCFVLSVCSAVSAVDDAQ